MSSGLHINFHKSSIIGINVDDHLCLRLATSIFCRSDSLPSKYLGMPLGANPSRISTWKPVIEKFRKRLHMWKGRLLSMAGRLCLIKSVLNSLPIYFMSVFKMPKGVGRLFSSIQRRFLWCGCTKQRSFCKIQWRLVMRDKKQGGLGVGSLISKNRALLLKWIWRLSSPGTSLWKMIISSMYNPAYENGVPIFYNQPSKIWKDIISIVQTDVHHVFTNHCKFMVGNGRLTSFWLDNWIGDYPLKTAFPRLYLLSSSKSTLEADMGR